MPARASFDYALIRVVPRVEREEFVNVGAILYCRTRAVLLARVAPDRSRLATLAPSLDLDEVQAHLDLIPLLCAGDAAAGPIARLSQSERFHWLVAPRSTVVQTSPTHSGTCLRPEAALDHIMSALVLLPGASDTPAAR